MEYGKEGIDIPMGVLYLIADPRRADINSLILEHASEMEDIIWQNLIAKYPGCKALGGVRIAVDNPFQDLLYNAYVGPKVCSYFFGDLPSFPLFVFRCPHVHNLLVNHRELKGIFSNIDKGKEYVIGQMWHYSLYSFQHMLAPGYKLNDDYKKLARAVGNEMALAFAKYHGITKTDIINFANHQRVSLATAKEELIRMMWEGEVDILSMEDKSLFDTDYLDRIDSAMQCDGYPKGLNSVFEDFQKYYLEHIGTVTYSGDCVKMERNFRDYNARFGKIFYDFVANFSSGKEKRNTKGCPPALTPMELEAEKMKSLLVGIYDPDKVKINRFGLNDFYLIMSRDNTNDLLHWLEENGKQLEDNLNKKGYTWCYVFECIAPSEGKTYHPLIYIYVGKDITENNVREYIQKIMDTAPEGRTFEFHAEPVSSIDLKRFYTKAEKIFYDSVDGIYILHDESTRDLSNYRTKVIHNRHLKDEKTTDVAETERENLQEPRKRGRKAQAVIDCIIGDDKEAILKEMKEELTKLPDGPTKAEYMNRIKNEGKLSKFPSWKALRNEGMIDLTEGPWNAAMSKYRPKK